MRSPFAADRTALVLVSACNAADLDPQGATLLRFARWLHAAGVPVIEVAEQVAQPILADDLPVSFWRAVDPQEPRPGAPDLAVRLRQFHDAGEPPGRLPDFNSPGHRRAAVRRAVHAATPCHAPRQPVKRSMILARLAATDPFTPGERQRHPANPKM
jgi:hypothetical protein